MSHTTPPNNPSTGRLHNKVAIITGSSSGLGRAISLAYAREGAYVVCADLSPAARSDFKSVSQGHIREGLEKEWERATHEAINDELNEERALFVQVDVTKAESWKEVVEKAVGWRGRVDILVNNAGISWESKHPSVPCHDMPEEAWDMTMAVNGKAVWLGCRAVIAQMLKQDLHEPGGHRGWFSNWSSSAGVVGSGAASCYAASKGAVANLTRSLAIEYAKDRIHVNALNPGFVKTGIFADTTQNLVPAELIDSLHPFGGAGVPEDIAGPAVFLASGDARWVTGVNLSVDGGYVAQ